MKAEAAQPALEPLVRSGVDVRAGRQIDAEGGVEDGHVGRRVADKMLGRRNAREPRRVVQRCRGA